MSINQSINQNLNKQLSDCNWTYESYE